MRTATPLPRKRLEAILAGMDGARVGLIGDLCLDLYWQADMTQSVLSRETPHHPLPIVEERISLGAGGNVAANLAALRPGALTVIGAIGEDWRGRELLRILRAMRIDDGFIAHSPDIVTSAYCKPLRAGISPVVYEDPRLDFENRAPLPIALEAALLQSLDAAAGKCSVLCVADQFTHGVITPGIRESLATLAAKGITVLVDSRQRIGQFRNCILKPNEVEAARAINQPPVQATPSLAGHAATAQALSAQTGCEVIMTVGDQGAIHVQNGDVTHTPAHRVGTPLDFVGAGDTYLAGYAMALATGASRAEAASLAGLCSEVTIQKIGTTGAASREEVLRRFAQVDTPV